MKNLFYFLFILLFIDDAKAYLSSQEEVTSYIQDFVKIQEVEKYLLALPLQQRLQAIEKTCQLISSLESEQRIQIVNHMVNLLDLLGDSAFSRFGITPSVGGGEGFENAVWMKERGTPAQLIDWLSLLNPCLRSDETKMLEAIEDNFQQGRCLETLLSPQLIVGGVSLENFAAKQANNDELKEDYLWFILPLCAVWSMVSIMWCTVPFWIYKTVSHVAYATAAAAHLSECSICLNPIKMDDKIAGHCGAGEQGHWYHLNCLLSWLAQHSTCPVCRRFLIEKVSRLPFIDAEAVMQVWWAYATRHGGSIY